MLTHRPFRFGTGMLPAPSRDAWVAQARKAEDLGYATIGAGGHPGLGAYFSPLPALMAIADATSEVRLSCLFANDFQNPVQLAMAAATLDFLSDGRLELGIGSGWLARDYAVCGIPFDPPRVRIDRLAGAVTLIKRLFDHGPVTRWRRPTSC
jgi:alkanesulfonate monooxygenase SsuD/methylene tetrahydromethanopterin reductase-like flavin-dependent oxidoreductase (luciferase family)